MSISRRFYTDNTVSTYPARSIAVNSSIDANLGVITFTLVSNLTPGLVLNYSLPNTSSTDFVEGNSGTLTVDGSGGATVVRTLNRYVNYSNTNVSSKLSVTSPAGTALVDSANFVIAPAVPFAATGGTTTAVNGNVVHTFSANSNLVITSLGEVNSEIVRSVIVGGGGAGNRATSFNEIILSAYNQWNRGSSGGGGGGGVLQPNLTVNAFSVTSYPVVVGAGGVCTGAETTLTGGNSSIFGYTAIRGGGGGASTQARLNGGSGAGGSTNTAFGVGTVGQGNDGGTGYRNSTGSNTTIRVAIASGGGGGGSAAGGNATPNSSQADGGVGGAGVISDITGSNVAYGPGGTGGGFAQKSTPTGGGTGGYFNASGSTATGGNGTDGVGGGGGGAGFGGANGTNTYNGGNGGRGTVIVAYRTQYRVLKPA